MFIAQVLFLLWGWVWITSVGAAALTDPEFFVKPIAALVMFLGILYLMAFRSWATAELAHSQQGDQDLVSLKTALVGKSVRGSVGWLRLGFALAILFACFALVFWGRFLLIHKVLTPPLMLALVEGVIFLSALLYSLSRTLRIQYTLHCQGSLLSV